MASKARLAVPSVNGDGHITANQISADQTITPAPNEPTKPFVTGIWSNNGKVEIEFHVGGRVIVHDRLNAAEAAARNKFAQMVIGHDAMADNPWNMSLDDVSEMVRERYQEMRDRPDDNAPNADDQADEPWPCDISKTELAATDPEIVEEAAEILRQPNLLEIICDDISQIMAGETNLVRLLYLFGVSRLLEKPLSVIVTGASSSGKSYSVSSVMKLFPPETKLPATDMSAKALYHGTENALRHRIVVSGERRHDQSDAGVDSTRQLREMISEGELSTYIVIRDENGKFVSQHINRKGPIAFIETTTLTEIFAEDENRCVVYPTDESVEQTKAILASAARAAAGLDEDKQHLFDRHHAIQRLLQRVDVVIPFAGELVDLAESRVSGNVEMRRAVPAILNSIQASAVLHQFQRERDDAGNVIATIDDYAHVLPIMEPWMTGIVDDHPTPALVAFYEKVKQYSTQHLAESHDNSFYSEPWFTRPQIVAFIKCSEGVAKRNLRALTHRGWLEIDWEGHGKKARYRLPPANVDLTAKAILPDPEEVAERHAIAHE